MPGWRLGFTQEAESFVGWLTERVRDDRSTTMRPLQLMYGIDGRADLAEETLDRLFDIIFVCYAAGFILIGVAIWRSGV